MKNLIEKLAPVLHRVEIVESKSIFPDFDFTPDNSHSIVTYPNPDGKPVVVNSCTIDYRLIRNEDILVPLLSVLEKRFESLDVNVRNVNNKRFFVDFHGKPDRKMEVGEIYPSIRFQGSYDNRLKFTVSAALFRVWCDNQCASPIGEMFKVNIKHRKRNIFNLEETIEMIENSLDSFPEVIKAKKALEAYPTAKIDKDLIEAMKKIVEETPYPVRQIESASIIAYQEMSKFNFKEMNLWLAYHGLNNVLNHDRSFAMDEHIRRDADKKVMANVMQIVEA